MKKALPVVALVTLILFLAGCSPPADQEGAAEFLLVSNYVDEILPAIGDVMLDLTGWFRDPLDGERLDWLAQGKKELAGIQKKHLGKKFPSCETMESWTLPVSRGEEKWTMEGEVFAPAVQELTAAVDSLIAALDVIIAGEGKLSDIKVAGVKRTAAEVDGAVSVIKELFRMY